MILAYELQDPRKLVHRPELEYHYNCESMGSPNGTLPFSQVIEKDNGSVEAKVLKIKALLLNERWEVAMMEARAAHEAHRGDGTVFQVRYHDPNHVPYNLTCT